MWIDLSLYNTIESLTEFNVVDEKHMTVLIQFSENINALCIEIRLLDIYGSEPFNLFIYRSMQDIKCSNQELIR